MVFRLRQVLNIYDVDVLELIVKPLTSNEVRPIQLKNIADILVTLAVLKLLRSSECSDLHS